MCTEGATFRSMQRGIGFAALMTAAISVLIVVVGSSIAVPDERSFTIEDLGDQIEATLGFSAKVIFCIGLYAAAFSSAITCPLGAALTAEQVLYEGRQSAAAAQPTRPTREDRNQSAEGEREGLLSDGSSEPSSGDGAPGPPLGAGFEAHGRWFRLSMVVSVAVAVAVSSSGVPTVSVISTAQVVNGLLLPFVVICLLLTLNDP